MQAYLLFLEIESAEPGKSYAMLPLHCTLVHWFWLDKNQVKDLAKQINQIVIDIKPMHLVANEKEVFVGHTKNGSIPVTVHKIQYSAEIKKLHYTLCDVLDKLNAQYSIPKYVRKGYIPHATNQKTGKLETGESHECMSLYLASADAPEYGNERKVIQQFDFSPRKKTPV